MRRLKLMTQKLTNLRLVQIDVLDQVVEFPHFGVKTAFGLIRVKRVDHPLQADQAVNRQRRTNEAKRLHGGQQNPAVGRENQREDQANDLRQGAQKETVADEDASTSGFKANRWGAAQTVQTTQGRAVALDPEKRHDRGCNRVRPHKRA